MSAEREGQWGPLACLLCSGWQVPGRGREWAGGDSSFLRKEGLARLRLA